MGRIEKMKRHFILEANKRILNENTSTDEDYDEAIKFCKEVEKWWEGSSNIFDDPEKTNDSTGTNYVDFFSRFNGLDDNEKNAAKAYKNMIFTHLKNTLSDNNTYYLDIKDWLDKIVNEIDDTFQHECLLTLSSKDGRSSDYIVDPEIDVDGIFGW